MRMLSAAVPGVQFHTLGKMFEEKRLSVLRMAGTKIDSSRPLPCFSKGITVPQSRCSHLAVDDTAQRPSYDHETHRQISNGIDISFIRRVYVSLRLTFLRPRHLAPPLKSGIQNAELLPSFASGQVVERDALVLDRMRGMTANRHA